ncbi:imm11 family protein [Archangium minus]
MNTLNSYFDFMDDMSTPGRWHLRSPVDARGQRVDPWQFKKGQPLDIEGVIRFPVNPTGIALEFTLASFLIPVVHRRVVALFERLGLQKEVQFIPVEVEGQTEPWFTLNVLQIIRCIDDARCEEVLYWLPEDNRPDKLGQYRNVAGLKVDPAKIGDAHIFRPWGWKVVLIVSEHVKRALEQEGITGIKFLEV